MKKNKRIIDSLLNKPVRIFQEFHSQTKIKSLPKKEQDYATWPKSWKIIHYKEYPRLPKIVLPKPALPDASFKTILETRTSSREFSKKSISVEDVSSLLYYSGGQHKNHRTTKFHRFYPSGGMRYPLELYILSHRSDLPRGLYHYNVKQHALETLLPLKTISFSRYFNLPWITDSSFLIITTALFYRTVEKYGDRGYRNILMEAGCFNQTVYLLCGVLNLACCQMGGFKDDALHGLLDIDGLHEAVVSVMAVGTK